MAFQTTITCLISWCTSPRHVLLMSLWSILSSTATKPRSCHDNTRTRSYLFWHPSKGNSLLIGRLASVTIEANIDSSKRTIHTQVPKHIIHNWKYIPLRLMYIRFSNNKPLDTKSRTGCQSLISDPASINQYLLQKLDFNCSRSDLWVIFSSC